MHTENLYEILNSIPNFDEKICSVKEIKRKCFRAIRGINEAKRSFSEENPEEKWLIENARLLEQDIKSIDFSNLELTRGMMYAIEKVVSLEPCFFRNEDVQSFFHWVSKSGSRSEKELFSIYPAFFIVLCISINKAAASRKELLPILFRKYHFLRQTDFYPHIAGVSQIEQFFRYDPAGVYRRMTRETQDLYRQRLEKEAKKRRIAPEKLAKEKLELAKERNCHIGFLLKKERHLRFYDFSHYLLTVFLIVELFLYMKPWYLSCLFFIPIYFFAKKITDFYASLFENNDVLPEMKIDRVDDENKTCVVITSLVGKKEDIDLLCEKLKRYQVNNWKKGDQLYFGLLLDFPESQTETTDNDRIISEYLKEQILQLNEAVPCYFGILRHRVFQKSEGKFSGWERKRGAIQQFVSFLNGTSALETHDFFGQIESLTGCRFLITLDQDTALSIGQAKRLIGTISHPLCEARLENKNGKTIVSSGYGIVQPRIMPSLLHPVLTPFGKISCNGGGEIPYARATFDQMQNQYGEGVFCGKGIIDVAAFDTVLKGKIPEQRILSHDMPEGAYLRCAIHSKEIFFDSDPQTVQSHYQRLHRWIRGDVQNLILFSHLKSFRKKAYFECISRYLLPLLEGGLLILSCLFGKDVGILTACLIFLFHFTDLISSIVSGIYHSNFQQMYRRFSTKIRNVFLNSLYKSAFSLSSIAFEAYYFADAMIRALYRMLVSKRKLLQWQVYSPVVGKNPILFFLPSTVIGAFALFICNNVVTLAIFLLWIFFPITCYYLSRPYPDREHWSEEEKRRFLSWAEREFQFFENTVSEKTRDLPPDNVQDEPVPRLAMRTSPTNIGLYFASLLAARDLGFINSKELEQRLRKARASLALMKRFHGHLYNWYSLENLQVIGEGFVSTVDSGNYVASLIAVHQGLKEYEKEEPRLAGIRKEMEKEISETDFSVLFHSEKSLFRIGVFPEREGGGPDYDLYMSEARITSYLAICLNQIKPSHWKRLGRPVLSCNGRAGVASWSGTAFEFFMPALFLPIVENSQEDESLDFAYYCQERFKMPINEKERIFGVSESGYADVDLHGNYQYYAFGIPALSVQCLEMTRRVISPYASFLMLERGRRQVVKNLDIMERNGLCGKFGYYEACEFHSYFINDFTVIRSYMSHHKGMSMVALTNALKGNVFVKRFLSFGDFSAKKELLAERFPLEEKVYQKKKQVDSFEKEKKNEKTKKISAIERYPFDVDGAKGKLLSDGKVALLVNSRGQIYIQSQKKLWFRPEGFDIRIHLEGTEYSFFHLQENTEEKSLRFGDDFVEYQISDKKILFTLKVQIIPGKNAVLFRLEMEGFRGKADVKISLQPILQDEKTYRSHPAFHLLSCEASSDGTFHRIRKRELEGHFYLHLMGNGHSKFMLSEEIVKQKGKYFPVFDRTVSLQCTFDSPGALSVPYLLWMDGDENEKELSYFLDENLQPKVEQSSEKGGYTSTFILKDECRTMEERIAAGFFLPNPFYLKKTLNPLPRDFLWRYGISGDYPIVLYPIASQAVDRGELAAFLKVAKKFLLSSIPLDFVVCHPEENSYFDPIRDATQSVIFQLNLNFLIGKHPGIHVVKVNSLDESHLTSLARLIIGKKENLEESVSTVTLSPRVSGGENKENDGTVGVMKGKRFLLDRKNFDPSVPFSHVISNRIIGFVCDQNSLGYTWAYNAALFRISRWENLPTKTSGEKIYLSFRNETYDLISISGRIVYQEHYVRYEGKINEKPFLIVSSVIEKIYGKFIFIHLDPFLAKDSKLTFSFVPVLGREEKHGILFENRTDHVIFSSSLEGEKPFFGYFSAKDRPIDLKKNENRIFFTVSPGEETQCFLGTFQTEKQLDYIMNRIRIGSLEDMASDEFEFCKKVMPRNFSGEMAFWSAYQAIYCRYFARSGLYQSGGAYGFRDQLQDALIFLDDCPEITKKQILRCASHQFRDGTVLHWWHPLKKGAFSDPGIRSECSDDYLWLPYAVGEYLHQTGDESILEIKAPFLKNISLESGVEEAYVTPEFEGSGTILEHLEQSVKLFISRGLGTHQLPLIGSGDWNDGMNRLGGESVWLAFFSSITLEKVKHYLNASLRREVDKILAALANGIEMAYNGIWYVRAFDKFGAVFGGDVSLESECSIDLITQAFSAFYYEVFQKEKYCISRESVRSSLLAAYEILFDSKSNTTALFQKPFVNTVPSPGYIQRYCAGFRENGGQYTHAAVWFSLALIRFGVLTSDADLIRKGKDIAGSIDPQKNLRIENFKKYQREPYVLCGDVYTAETLEGHGGWSWYTGAAQWFYRLLSEIEKMKNES